MGVPPSAHMLRRSPKRTFQRRTLRREQLRAILRDVHIIFQPHTELAPDIYTRLVAGSHVGLKLLRIPANQIRPFMPIHTHAVSKPMREIFVIGTITCVADYFAGGRVDRSTLRARFCRRECATLRTMDDIENLLHLVTGLSQYKCARDI